jgi:hypothetical protein
MTQSNRELLLAAARVLQPLAGELVFVGGSATGLMITDAAAADARSTYDVDVIAEIASYSAYRALGKRLRSLGFQEDTSEGAPLCRWQHQRGITLDVMLTDEKILGFSNRWYPEAVISSKWEELEQGIKIRVVTPPYFSATKLVAFRGRGRVRSKARVSEATKERTSNFAASISPASSTRPAVAGGLIRVGERLRERGALLAGGSAGGSAGARDPAGPVRGGCRRGAAGAFSELRLRRRSPRPARPWLEARPAAHFADFSRRVVYPFARCSSDRKYQSVELCRFRAFSAVLMRRLDPHLSLVFGYVCRRWGNHCRVCAQRDDVHEQQWSGCVVSATGHPPEFPSRPGVVRYVSPCTSACLLRLGRFRDEAASRHLFWVVTQCRWPCFSCCP